MRIDYKTLDSSAFVSLFFVMGTLCFSIALFEISSAIFLGLTLLLIIHPEGQKRAAILRNGFVFLAVLYFLINVLSLTQTAYWAVSLRGLFKVLKNIVLCLAVFTVVDSKERFRKVFEFFLLAAVLISIDALLQGVIGFDLIRRRHMIPYITGVGRLTGPFRHPNDFSAYLSFVIFLFLGMLRDGFKLFDWKKYLFILAGTILVSACLVGTYSRGAWLAVIVSFVSLVVFKRSKWLLTIFLLLGIWAFLFSPPLIKARVTSLWSSKGGTLVERVSLWRESFAMIKKSPFLGLGVNTYARNEPFFKTGEPNIDNQYAHNGYLQIAAETGLLGLFSFLSVLLYFFWRTGKRFLKTEDLFLKTAGTALLFGIFAFLLHSTIDTNLQSVLLVNTLWLAMGVTLAAEKFA